MKTILTMVLISAATAGLLAFGCAGSNSEKKSETAAKPADMAEPLRPPPAQ